MRILGFNKMWDKLNNPFIFTTFRYPRGDTDWQVGEQVRVVIKPRRKDGGDKLGVARIISRERRELDRQFYKLAKGDCAPLATDSEAQEDGFTDLEDMNQWMEKTHGRLDYLPCMNKLTLKWIERFNAPR